MLLMGHIVIGLITGFILYEIFHARSIIVFCALGSVLPDIVDKPLGHIIFSSSLDTGRIFFHSLLMVLLFLIMGLIIWNYYRSFSFIMAGFGMFLHQAADEMWNQPVNWYYPVFGPFQPEIFPDYFQQAILEELSSVTEWIFFAAIVVAALLLYRNQSLYATVLEPDPGMQIKTKKFYGGLAGVALFVLALTVIIVIIRNLFLNY